MTASHFLQLAPNLTDFRDTLRQGGEGSSKSKALRSLTLAALINGAIGQAALTIDN